MSIQAYAGNTNVALGKPVSSNAALSNSGLITDGDKNIKDYTQGSTGAIQWVRIDLGQKFSLGQVKLWHYFADARKYHDVIVQFSNDTTFLKGVTTVFNNDSTNILGQGIGKDKEYTEVDSGKTISFPAISARYLRTFLNGNTIDKVNYWTEIEAYSTGTNPSAFNFNLVPWPQAVIPGTGGMSIKSSSRIVATDTSLLPLANIVAGEISAITGINPSVIQQAYGLNGDVVLKVNAALTGKYQCTTNMDAITTIEGKDVNAVAMGSVNISQLISSNGSLPKTYIEDNTKSKYSELMIDVAREFNDIHSLERCIIMCRLYKIPFFRLHITDDYLWMFQSTNYPQLGVGNYVLNNTDLINKTYYPPYTQAQLKALVQFAKDRGVIVVPEIECLGHSGRMRHDRPDLFGTAGVNNVASDTFYMAITNIIKEMAQVFTTSPYIHIGGDEGGMASLMTYPRSLPYLTAHNITTQNQLWIDFLSRMNTIVKGVGKKTCLWEGYYGRTVAQALTPKSDYLIFEYDGYYYNPFDVKTDGFSMVNVPWVPSVYNSPADNYAWNMWLLGSNGRTPDQLPLGDSSVAGGSMVLWQVTGGDAIPLLRATTAARQERIYNTEANKTYTDFQARFNATDSILQKLFKPISITASPVGFIVPATGQNCHKHVIGTSGVTTFTIVNNGDVADLVISSVAITGISASPYAITGDTGEKILKPGKTRTITVTYTPFTACVTNGNYLTLTSNDPVNPIIKSGLAGSY